MPIDTAILPLFVAASLAMLVTPGPAVMYIVARSLEGGRLAGLVAMCGITVGGAVHVLLAAVGVAALLAASPTAFTLLRYAGIAYLLYLGISTLMRRPAEPGRDPEAPGRRLAELFWEGVLVNVLNPKTMLFILAFLPQFADPGRGALWLQILVLGLIFETLGLLSDGVYALAAGTVRSWLGQHPAVQGGTRVFTGLVFLGLATGALVWGPR